MMAKGKIEDSRHETEDTRHEANSNSNSNERIVPRRERQSREG